MRGIAPALLLCGAMLPATQAEAATASATSTAEVIPPVTMYKDQDLDFSMIATAGAGGSVTIAASDGTVSTTGDLAIVGSNVPHRALFKINAPVGTVMVYSGDASVTLTRSGGTETMNASLSYNAGSGLVTALVFGIPIGVQAINPEQEINVGGTLNVATGQAEGAYQGQFNLTVAYL